MIQFVPVEKRNMDGIIRLCEDEGWESYALDPEVTWKALNSAGVCTVVAEQNEEAVGFAQMQSDGVVQAHLSLIVVARNHRRRGIGTRLISEAFTRSGGKRVDLITEDAQAFYRSFAHKEQCGFRMYPDGERRNP